MQNDTGCRSEDLVRKIEGAFQLRQLPRNPSFIGGDNSDFEYVLELASWDWDKVSPNDLDRTAHWGYAYLVGEGFAFIISKIMVLCVSEPQYTENREMVASFWYSLTRDSSNFMDLSDKTYCALESLEIDAIHCWLEWVFAGNFRPIGRLDRNEIRVAFENIESLRKHVCLTPKM